MVVFRGSPTRLLEASDGFTSVADVSTRRIERLRRERDVDALVEELQNARGTSSVGLREQIARALGEAQDQRAVETLTRLMSSDSDEIVAATAAKALGQIGDASAVPDLMQALSKRPDVVKAWAADSLARLDGHDATPALAELLSGEDPRVRLAAAQALGRLGGLSVVPDLSRAAARERWFRRGIYRKAIRSIRARHRRQQ
jgi:HEAT repeat protein